MRSFPSYEAWEEQPLNDYSTNPLVSEGSKNAVTIADILYKDAGSNNLGPYQIGIWKFSHSIINIFCSFFHLEWASTKLQ